MKKQRDKRVLDRFRPPEDNNPTPYILVYYDMFFLIFFYMSRR
jgi:hypothetical protein